MNVENGYAAHARNEFYLINYVIFMHLTHLAHNHHLSFLILKPLKTQLLSAKRDITPGIPLMITKPNAVEIVNTHGADNKSMYQMLWLPRPPVHFA